MTDKYHLTEFLKLLDLDEENENTSDKPFPKQLKYATQNLWSEFKENPSLMSGYTDEWVVKFIERVRFVIIENNIVPNIELS